LSQSKKNGPIQRLLFNEVEATVDEEKNNGKEDIKIEAHTREGAAKENQ
jgi:hypothetical protein